MLQQQQENTHSLSTMLVQCHGSVNAMLAQRRVLASFMKHEQNKFLIELSANLCMVVKTTLTEIRSACAS